MNSEEIIDKLQNIVDSMHCCTLKEPSTHSGKIMEWRAELREVVKKIVETENKQ